MKDFILTLNVTADATCASSGLYFRCGFVPRHVIIRGRTSSNSVEWFSSMPDASKYTSDDTSGTSGFAYSASGGITPVNGTDAIPTNYYTESIYGAAVLATGAKPKQGFFAAGAVFTNTEIYDVFIER